MPDMGVAERAGLTLGTVEAPSGAYASFGEAAAVDEALGRSLGVADEPAYGSSVGSPTPAGFDCAAP